MADSSEDPRDIANLRRLEARLDALHESISRDNAEARKIEDRKDRRGAKEERRSRTERVADERRAAPRRAGEVGPAAVEERITRARAAQGRFTPVELYGWDRRLSKAENMLRVEKDLGQIRARNALAASRASIERFGVPASVGRGVQLPGRRGTISDEEYLARNRPPAPRQRPVDLLGPQGEEARQRYIASRTSGAPQRIETQYAQQAAQAQTRERAALASVNQELARSVQMHGQASNALRRHGALTTEFFEALARGEVTMAEVRYQVGATIAKFGGWTAAAGLVIGAVNAVRLLGKGAIDTGSGVAQLNRYINDVDPSEAQRKLVDYSQQFNLPIDQVAEATARMGQVFHTQAASFEAAKAVLYAVQIGELNVGDASKYLISIINGFKLPANQLVNVFDKINAVQNRYGVSIRDTVAGTAKAAGAWRAAGGDLNTLLALITVAKRDTGRSGESIGTALQRSAEGIYRRPLNQAQLRSFGIDPTKDIEQIYSAAFRKVQSGQVKGRDITKLGAALSTPQYAPVLSAVLQDQKLFNQVKRTLGGDVASVRQNEFKQFLASTDQQIAKIGISLQALGSELGQSGALDVLGAMLKALNGTLTLAINLSKIFNELPAPLRKGSIYMLEIAAAAKIAGRFGGFSRILPGGSARVEARQAAGYDVAFHGEQSEAATARLRQARYNEARALEYQTAINRSSVADEDARNAASNRVTAAQTATAEAEFELQFATERLAVARNAQAGLIQNLARGLPPRQAAENAGVPIPVRGAPGRPGGPVPPGPYRVAGPRPVDLRPQPGLAEKMPVTTRALAAGETAVVAAAAAATSLGTAAKARMLPALASLGAFLADPLVLLLGGYFAGTAYYDHIKKEIAKTEKFGAGPTNSAQARAVLGTRDPSDIAQKNADLELDILIRQNRETRAGRPAASRFTDQILKDARRKAKQLKGGFTTVDAAQKEIDRLAKEIPLSRSSEAEKRRAEVAIQDLRDQLGPGRGRSLRQIIEGLDPKDFTKRVQADADAIGAYLTAFGVAGPPAFKLNDLLKRSARTGNTLAPLDSLKNKGNPDHRAAPFVIPKEDPLDALMKDLRTSYAAALAAVRKDPTDQTKLKTLADARQALDSVVTSIASQLDSDLKYARTSQQRAEAFANARAVVAKLPRGEIRKHAMRDLLEKAYQSFAERLDSITDLQVSISNDPARDAQLKIAATGREIARAIRVYGRDSNEVRALIGKQYENYRAAADAAVSLIASQGSIAVARATTPGDKARAQLASDEAQLAAMRQSGRYSDAELNEQVAKVLQEKQDLVKQINDDARALADSVFDLRESQTPNEAKRRSIELQRAKEHLRTATTPTEKNQAKAEINNNRRAVVQGRQSDWFDTLEFQESIGKITQDQEKRQLEAYLRRHKNLAQQNRDFYRQLKQRIYAIDHDTGSRDSFELNVGDIRLPTVYEVRRALGGKGARGVTSANYSVANSNTITLYVAKGADMAEVGRVLERYTGANVRSQARAAGAVG